MIEAKKDKLKDEIKKATRSGEGIDREELRRQQTEPESLSEPTERRYIINDSTVEKVGELLNQNPRGLLLFRDELTGWLRSLDREGREGDRAFYLEAWAGTEDFTYDRIGRGTLHIKRVTLSILGSIQPGPLASYLRYTLADGHGDDGLLQRSQLMVYPDVSANWRNIDRFPDTAHKNRAFEIFKQLDAIDALELGAFICEEDGQIPYLRFNEEGQAFFDSWRTDLEKATGGSQLEYPALEPASHTQTDRLLTVKEAADFLSVKARTIYAWVQQRRIPFRRAGRLLRFDRVELSNWAASQAQEKSAKELLRVVNS